MSFVKRGLAYVIQLNGGDDQQNQTSNYEFDNGSTTLNIDGVRSMATIESVLGGDTAFGGSALIQIWGMKPSDMAQLSTLGFDQNKFGKNTITVFAYDTSSSNQVQVFSGGIFSAHINYNAMPDISLELECYATWGMQTQSIPATSVEGPSDVATMLQGICAACNPQMAFVNKGVSVKLSNHACSGSAHDQITDICCAAGICHSYSGNTLFIWPKDQSVDGVTIVTGPENGMVGYPEYTQQGIDLTMEFNPEVQLGRQITIDQAPADANGNTIPVPGVPGTFWVNVAGHELSSQLPGGPWFTHASVSTQQIVGRS